MNRKIGYCIDKKRKSEVYMTDCMYPVGFIKKTFKGYVYYATFARLFPKKASEAFKTLEECQDHLKVGDKEYRSPEREDYESYEEYAQACLNNY